MTICLNYQYWPMLVNDPLSNSLEKKATRDGYGVALEKLGATNSKIVVLDADLSGSTKTKGFATKYPTRFFNYGVAEQNLVGNAAGFARTGLVPFASTFAMFLSGRAWEVVRNTVAYPRENVKLVATHAGITLGEDGASHQSLEDIAIMRAIPNMTVIVPSDYNQTIQAINAVADFNGPVYVRLGRPNIPVIHSETGEFKIGKAKTIQEGAGVAFVSTGIMVYESWKAARLLEQETGIRPYVIDMHTVKPLDTEALAALKGKVKHVFTFEEHNIIGGLGSAVSEYVSQDAFATVSRIGINDQFGQSGTPSGLMEYYGLNGENLVKKVRQILGEKKYMA